VLGGKLWNCVFLKKIFYWDGWARRGGDFAHCGERPETLSLDSAAFEKAGETFIGAPLGDFVPCGARPGALPLDPAAFRERRAKAFSALRASTDDSG